MKRGAKIKYYRLKDGKRVTIQDIMKITGLTPHGARMRLKLSNDPKNIFREIAQNKIPNMTNLRILMSRPAYDPMFILAMKKI